LNDETKGRRDKEKGRRGEGVKEFKETQVKEDE
jgi:hypothetical protein